MFIALQQSSKYVCKLIKCLHGFFWKHSKTTSLMALSMILRQKLYMNGIVSLWGTQWCKSHVQMPHALITLAAKHRQVYSNRSLQIFVDLFLMLFAKATNVIRWVVQNTILTGFLSLNSLVSYLEKFDHFLYSNCLVRVMIWRK